MQLSPDDEAAKESHQKSVRCVDNIDQAERAQVYNSKGQLHAYVRVLRVGATISRLTTIWVRFWMIQRCQVTRSWWNGHNWGLIISLFYRNDSYTPSSISLNNLYDAVADLGSVLKRDASNLAALQLRGEVLYLVRSYTNRYNFSVLTSFVDWRWAVLRSRTFAFS